MMTPKDLRDLADALEADQSSLPGEMVARFTASQDMLFALELLLVAKESDTLYVDSHWAPARAAVAKARGQ